MRFTRVLVALALVASMLGASPLVAGARPPADHSAGRWIVTLKPGAGHPGRVAADHARGRAASVTHVYDTAIRGYAATMSRKALARARRDARVALIEPDHTAVAFHHRAGHEGGPGGSDPDSGQMPVCIDDEAVPWGVDRVGAVSSSANIADDTCDNGPTGATVYVLDTGATSPDLNVIETRSFTRGPKRDCNGHGTHVAGTAAARDNGTDVVGVAPGAQIVALRVLGCDGAGPYSGVIAALDYLARLGRDGTTRVANMSFGGPASLALDNAVKSAVDAGVFFAIAAGNQYGADACDYSPARVGLTTAGAITVGATSGDDSKARFSNDGTCVEMWAPGEGITSLAVNGGIATFSGTSMASPHVAGGAALYHTANGGSPANVENALVSVAEGSLPLLDVSGY